MTTKYEFNHELDYLETGDLKNDIYNIVKLELSDLFKEKYKIYLSAFCGEENPDIAKYYSEYYQLLNRIAIIIKDKQLTDIKDYALSLSKGNADINNKNSEINTLISSLREIDDLIILFCYDIINYVQSKNSKIDLKRGAFSIINLYFNNNEKPMFKTFGELLDNLYGITYRVMRLKYKENKYGKK